MRNRDHTAIDAQRSRTHSLYSVSERGRQARWKRTSKELSEGARKPGRYKDAQRVSFILPIQHADDNLWQPIRNDVMSYFDRHDIAWHDGDNQAYGVRASPGPSPHLLDSQVAAMNFWWGLARAPSALAVVLRTAFPNLAQVVPATDDDPLVIPEWIGEENYLGEYVPAGHSRQRGRYATSADALIHFECVQGLRHAILLESKYSEHYPDDEWKLDRAATYRRAFEAEDGPFAPDVGVPLDALMIEPFYQLMRQQLLARAMERARERGVASVTVLHVSPCANRAFHEGVTSPELRQLGDDVIHLWPKLLSEYGRFVSTSYETCLARAHDALASAPRPEQNHLELWLAYQRSRYGW